MKRLGCFRFFPLIVLLLLTVSLNAQAQNEYTLSGKVVSVSDGDMITILEGTEQHQIRLHGIDCPESSQAFGSTAKRFTGNACLEKTISVLVRDQDHDATLLGEVFLPDGTNFNHALVANGLAWWDTQHAAKDKDLALLEMKAKVKKVGLWSAANPVAPWDFRAGDKDGSKAAAAKEEALSKPFKPTAEITNSRPSVTPQPIHNPSEQGIAQPQPMQRQNGPSGYSAPAQSQAQGEVYITDTGMKFHESSCRYLKSRIPISKADAISRGYEACKGCKP